MSNKGARSIEVVVQNMTMANFTIQGASLSGVGAEWIQNEEPKQGAPLTQYTTVTIGVMNNDYNSSAGGEMVLTGYGSPITITFENNEQGVSTCTCSGNSEVQATTHQVDTGELNHSQFTVKLTQS